DLVDGNRAPGAAVATHRVSSATSWELLLFDMRAKSSAIVSDRPVLSPDPRGLAWGLLGVAGFSLTVPLTRIAVESGAMSPLFVAAGRAVVAAVLATLALALTGQRLPNGHQWRRIAVVPRGVVIAFP